MLQGHSMDAISDDMNPPEEARLIAVGEATRRAPGSGASAQGNGNTTGLARDVVASVDGARPTRGHFDVGTIGTR